MNRKTLLSVSALALVAMAGAANAADVGPLPRDWSGLYGGLHIGLATEPDSSLKIESSTNELTESVSTLAPVSKIRCYKYTNKGKYIENEFDKCPTGWTEVKTGDDDDDDDDGGGTIVNPLANLSSGDDLNFLAGINIGYNYQHGQMVFGVEADISGIPDGTERLSGETLDLAGDGSYALTSASGEFGVSNVMTLRARLGYDIDGTWMPFITGGLAWGKVNTKGTAYYELYDGEGDVTKTETSRFGDDDYEMGWTLGAGVNYRIAENAFLGLTYLYTDLGKHSFEDSYSYEGINYGLEGSVKGEVDARFHSVRLSFDIMF